MQTPNMVNAIVKPKWGGKHVKGHPDQEAAEHLQVQAYELRLQGFVYREIAEKLGYSTESGARNAVSRARERFQRDKGEELREIELDRLDKMLISLQQKLDAGDLFAIDRAVKLMERRAKLAGLDRKEEENPETLTRFKAEITRLIEQGFSEADAKQIVIEAAPESARYIN